jgi:MYXO-CTERM domain-containing protein
VFQCTAVYFATDPPSSGVAGLSISLQTNPSIYTFDPAISGPLSIFSIGGGAAPVSPGVGTQPAQLLPATGFNPDAPLAGSTLTYTDFAGLLTLDYQLASPVTVNSDVNFFLFGFDFVHAVIIDLATSTVTYSASGPGGDFTQTSFSCSGVGGSMTCGSSNPATGITCNFSVVPEPPAWTLALIGLSGLGAALRRRRDRGLLWGYYP